MSGALLVLVMGLSLAFVPVVLFPVLRRVDEVLAIWLIARGLRPAAVSPAPKLARPRSLHPGRIAELTHRHA